ncbi:MAG TPA: tRNA (adenosine(37)-N6)-threonylcarbamoyltransferase complex dimerization subunit type 1 TsaB [Chitinophagaceae bacterium]|nr:tRNA (adenosine(37)-N6)-threonylcarbamoyltransferase complex dimerization subunit type 1 TsaB [Chitinophagaceae bacterium]
MPLILNIDSALETASVCLSEKLDCMGQLSNGDQKDHAAWLHEAIRQLLLQSGKLVKDLEAVAVSIGPGSYTGLRVGLSTAKGLCYALGIPLITVETLKLMAFAVKEEAKELICPLIDARRMEVYTALYDNEMTEKQQPRAMIIDENSFSHLLSNHNLTFCGSGQKKLKKLITNDNASWTDSISTALHLSLIADQYFREGKFADLAYTEPLYIKDFHTGHKSVK